MTATYGVYFVLGVLSLISVFFLVRRGIGSTLGTPKMRKIAAALLGLLLPTLAYAQPEQTGGGEANLVLPDLTTVNFFGLNGHALLMIGLLFCVGGLLFGLAIYTQLKNLPVHRSMREISEMIYETCKTYLVTQGKFILLLWAFIAVIIALYFGYLAPVPGKSVAVTLPIILGVRFSASRAATAWRGSAFV